MSWHPSLRRKWCDFEEGAREYYIEMILWNDSSHPTHATHLGYFHLQKVLPSRGGGVKLFFLGEGVLKSHWEVSLE
jgi:hypothetical protein